MKTQSNQAIKTAPFRSTESPFIEMNIEVRLDEINGCLRSYHVYINGEFVYSLDSPDLSNYGGAYKLLLKKLNEENGFKWNCYHNRRG